MSRNTDSSCKIALREMHETGIVIMDVTGEIDISTTPDVGSKIEEIISQKKYKIIINLEDAGYVSSTGWGLFISKVKELRENKGDLKLAAMKQEVQDIFNMTSIVKLISCYDTLDEAIASFKKGKRR